MTATIIVNKPGEPLRTVVLTDLTSIGRAIDNTVAIDSATMSRYHTVIEKRGEDYWLKDLSSGNGTRLNGELVYEPSKLENGDTFILGEYGPIEFRQQNSVDHTDYPRVPGVNDSAVFSSPWSSEVLNPRPTPSQEYLAQFETISDELPELQASVVVSSPGISAHQIDLSEHTRIGRAEDNLICIDDAAVSRYHATIERKTDGFWLKDLGSSNGTTVNGNDAIKATKLNNGDLILIGGVGRIEFRSNEWSRQEAKIDSRLNGKSAGNHLSPYATIGSAIDPSDVMSISKAGVEQVAIINLKVAGHQGQEIEIAGTTNIGRAFDNKICIDDPSLSRYHAKIEQEKDGFWITDFSSGNGTMRNGNPITERTLLSEGDVLSVGSAKLHFGYTPKPVGGMKEPAPRRAQPAPPPMPAPPPDDSTKVISMPQLGAAAGAESLFPSVSGLTPPGVPNLSAPSIPGSPAPAVPTVPSVSAPQIPSMPQPPTPPALPQSQLEEMGKTIIRVSIAIGASVAALVIGLLIILALMFFFGGRESGKSKQKDNGDIVADHRSDNDRPAESKSVIGEQTSQNPSGPTNPGSAPAIATTSPGGDPSSSTPSADPLAQKAQVMMAALTQRGGDSYVFSTEVVDRIRGRLGEVKNPAVLEQIKKDRQVIRKAFSSDNPLPRNLGLILALSRSTNSGAANSKQDLWHLPDFVIAQYAGSDSANTNRDSEQSAWIAATHMRHLVIDVFRGEQNLLYAVACFGLSDQKARDLQRNLQQIDPNGQRRLNFWSMVEQQVVTGEEVEQVVRFLAAAIVAQNPSEYGIQMPPFSDL